MDVLKKITILSAVLILSAGCIREDRSRCDNLTLNLLYLADGDRNVIGEYMNRIDLYIFSGNGEFIETAEFTSGQLEKCGYCPSMQMQPGEYSIVAIGNAYGRTEVDDPSSGTPEEILIHHPSFGEEATVNGHDHLYIGFGSINVGDGKEHNSGVVTMHSSHINMDFEIYGLPAPGKADSPVLNIIDANAAVSLTNEVQTDAKTDMVLDIIYDTSDGCYRTDSGAMLRIDSDGSIIPELCTHKVRLTSGNGETLAEFGLMEFIEEHMNPADVCKEEATIPVSLKFSGTSVVIDVQDWYINDVDPDFGV